MNENQNIIDTKSDDSNSPANDIFKLLDTDQDGYIHKDDFLDKMKTFMKNSESCNKVTEEIEDFLGDEEWIDEEKFIEFYSNTYSNSPSNSSNSDNSLNRKRFTRIVYPGSLVDNGEAVNSATDSYDANDGIDWYERYQEVYEFYEREKAEKEKLQDQEIDLKRMFRDERNRADEKEAQLYDLRLLTVQERKEQEKVFEDKKETIELKYQSELQDWELRLMEARKESRRLGKLCETDEREIEELRQTLANRDRDLVNLKNSLHDTKALHADFKLKSSNQIIELQAERDMLEIACKNMETQLLTLKHLPGPLVTPATSPATTDMLANTQKGSRFDISSSGSTSRMGRSKSVLVGMGNNLTSNTKLQVTMEIDELNGGDLVHRLTMENKRLVERIAHLETIEFYQRQKLEAANCLSIAAELEQLNMEELKKGLSLERETVKTLQKYINDLTTKLLLAGCIDVFEK